MALAYILEPKRLQKVIKKQLKKQHVFKTPQKQLFEGLRALFWHLFDIIFGTCFDIGEHVKIVLGLEREPFPASLEGFKNHTFLT